MFIFFCKILYGWLRRDKCVFYASVIKGLELSDGQKHFSFGFILDMVHASVNVIPQNECFFASIGH